MFAHYVACAFGWYHWKTSLRTVSRRKVQIDIFKSVLFSHFAMKNINVQHMGRFPNGCTLLALALTVQLLCCKFWHICNTYNLNVLKKMFLIKTFLDLKKIKNVHLLHCHCPVKALNNILVDSPGYLLLTKRWKNMDGWIFWSCSVSS